mmetsp:Transcript_22585/g.62867  ORF Transcript_22585/g.62867 Transcript_22585/m.62867 type:complete len:225 (-) Transcript_22585:87-761(-)
MRHRREPRRAHVAGVGVVTRRQRQRRRQRRRRRNRAVFGQGPPGQKPSEVVVGGRVPRGSLAVQIHDLFDLRMVLAELPQRVQGHHFRAERPVSQEGRGGGNLQSGGSHGLHKEGFVLGTQQGHLLVQDFVDAGRIVDPVHVQVVKDGNGSRLDWGTVLRSSSSSRSSSSRSIKGSNPPEIVQHHSDGSMPIIIGIVSLAIIISDVRVQNEDYHDGLEKYGNAQ